MNEITFGSGSGHISPEVIALAIIFALALAIFLWLVFRRGGH